MKCSSLWFFSLLTFTFLMYADPYYAQNTELYNAALKSLKDKDTSSAEEYLAKSIKENSDLPSYILLSDLYVKVNSTSYRTAALDLLNNAIIKYPDSLRPKLHYAAILERSYRSNAIDLYKNIIRKDSDCYEAWYRLEILYSENLKYYNKASNISDEGTPLSTYEFSKGDFQEAENCIKRCIQLNPKNFAQYLNLSFVYEETNNLGKAVEILNAYASSNYPKSKEVFLYLGHLYTKISKNREAYNAFNNAMNLMDDREKEDFSYNTIKFVLNNLYTTSQSKDLNEADLKNIIDVYWNIEDPLRLTEYNERLLEHYSRVAYANVHFTRNDSNTPGWKTNQGETILRYGEPQNYIRLNKKWSGISGDEDPPYIMSSPLKPRIPGVSTLSPNSNRIAGALSIPNEIFYYPDMRIAFADWSLSGNFVFNTPNKRSSGILTQVSDNTESMMNILRKNKPVVYNPKFEGLKITIPFNLLQFRNINTASGLSDVYLCYGIEENEKEFYDGNKNYLEGIFFYDRFFRPLIEYKDTLNLRKCDSFTLINNNKVIINSVKMAMPPDSGFFCFEMVRNSDKAVSSNHGKVKIRKFCMDSLSVSDIVLASKIVTDGSKKNWLTRKQVCLVPNPTYLFSKAQDLYVYYELYNLNLDPKGNCSFEQAITITDRNYGKKSIITRFFNSVGGLIGLSNEDKRLSLVSTYNLKNKDQQMYLQLDLSQYEPGDYKIAVLIKDKLTGMVASSETELTWQ